LAQFKLKVPGRLSHVLKAHAVGSPRDDDQFASKCGDLAMFGLDSGRHPIEEWPPDVLGMPHFAPDGTRDRRSARPSPKVALAIPVARSSTAGCLASTPNSLVSSDAPTVIGAGCTQIFLPGKGKLLTIASSRRAFGKC